MVGITKDDGALPSRGLGGASEKSGLLVVLGYIGAQTWLPIVGVVADMYRGGDLALSGLNPLLFSYLVVLGTTACAASFARWRDEWSRGVFGAFAGALAAIAGAALLLVPERGASVAVAVLRVVSGALLGLGGGLLTMVWSERFGRLDAPARSRVSFLVVLAACLLAAFAQSIGIHWLLLAVVAVFSAVSSALFMVSASRGEAPAKTSSPVTHLQGAFVRIIASYGLFGLVFALMITQFLIARHGHALSWTWLLSLSGVVISLVVEVVAKALLKQGFSWLLLLRFAAIPVLVAFYPFDAGSEFSLRFAMGASAVALWVYLSLVVGVAAEAAGQIRVPFAIVWGVALGALALGAALGSSLALMMESLDLQGHVSVTAIAAMVLAVIASDVVLTRGSLARAYKRAVTAAGGKEAESADGGTPFDERVAAVAEVYALTEREAEVLGILARGHGLGRVQEVLFIAEGTAITHRRHIYQKLDVHSKAELIDLVSGFGDDGIDDD